MRVPLFPLVLAVAAAGCDRPSPPAGQGGGQGNATAPAPDEVVATDAPAEPAKGLDRSHRGEAAPAHAFAGPDGKPTSLAAFRGRPVLVNLWATWCAPCVKELPTLDALAAKGGVEVVALSQDNDAAKARSFLASKSFRALKPYTDPDLRWMAGGITSLPTTILYDAQGREVWRWLGDADWTGAAAAKALAEA